jgi:hypothetical protein
MVLFTGKKLSIFLHIAARIIVLLLPVFLTSIERRQDINFIGRIFVRTAIYAIIFYISYAWLIPKLLFKEKKIQFFLTIIAIIIGLYFVNETVNRTFFVRKQFAERSKSTERIRREPRYPWRFDIYNYFFTTILITGFSVGLRMSGKYNENEKRRKELEKEKLSSELAFLKNQVSPHFFFNTLNNIYSLTEINAKEAQNAILQLSKLMRYLLYESEKGDTSLRSEIAFMKNYIDLMKLRLSEKVTLTYVFPEEFKDRSIPPLLFIPFIENAFKHGISYREKSFINIRLETDGNTLKFICINSDFSKKDDLTDSGIGLENARKRLALLFPGKHTLKIDENIQTFEVSLTITNSEATI